MRGPRRTQRATRCRSRRARSRSSAWRRSVPLMRRIAAVLVIVASLLVPFAVTALWLRGEILDTHRYVRTVAPLARDDAVVSGVADALATALLAQADADEVAKEALPGALGGLAPTVEASVHLYTQKLIERGLRTSAFER